ncbi:predicted membrane protein [Haemophilus influenzae 22.1-21]|nr:predicted membrane protein [Haemophilus influenzae 22.1-21]
MDIFSFFSTDFWQANSLCLMFISAFLSATVLPGNSEVVFVALAVPKLVLGSLFNTDILALVFSPRLAMDWGV